VLSNTFRFRALSSKELSTRLTKNLRALEKFKHVNRKAIDQFMMLNDKRAELIKKKDELDKGKKVLLVVPSYSMGFRSLTQCLLDSLYCRPLRT
jgi:chromosome segregation ATPase